MLGDRFIYAITPDNRHMVMCPEDVYRRRTAAALLREKFPHLARRDVKKMKECGTYRDFSSNFDGQIKQLTDANDWKKKPFAVLQVFDRDGQTFCSAEAVNFKK